MSTRRAAYAEEHASLFAEHRARPLPLLLELAWSWSCGMLLLTLFAYDGWRIWSSSLAAIRANGALPFTTDALLGQMLANPALLVARISRDTAILWPQIERGALGIAPFAIFCWILAFAFGRAAVLTRFDARLPYRPWMLAAAETLRLFGALLIAGVWIVLFSRVVRIATEGVTTGGFVVDAVLFAAACLLTAFSSHFYRTVYIGMALALVEHCSLRNTLQRAWRMDKADEVLPLRRAVKRIRLILLGVALVLTFIPAPFGWGWALIGWWVVLAVPPLLITKAWRLGAFFALLRIFQIEPEFRAKP